MFAFNDPKKIEANVGRTGVDTFADASLSKPSHNATVCPAGFPPVRRRAVEHLRRRDITSGTRRQELRYGSAEFLAASEWARRLPDAQARTALASLVRRPAVVRDLAAIWRLPIIDLRVRKYDADAWWFGHWFGPRRLGRLGRAVLELPSDEARYLAGHPRRILRNKLRHARAAGVTSARVGYDTWANAAADVLRARGEEPGPNTARHARPTAYYVAWDGPGTPLAFASVALFGQFAVLFLNVSRPDRRPEASWARYQLHTCLALDLGSYGVRHLLTGSALREPAGVQYFQHVLGYQVRNLRVELVLPAPGGPRTLGCCSGDPEQGPRELFVAVRLLSPLLADASSARPRRSPWLLNDQ